MYHVGLLEKQVETVYPTWRREITAIQLLQLIEQMMIVAILSKTMKKSVKDQFIQAQYSDAVDSVTELGSDAVDLWQLNEACITLMQKI